MGSDDLFHKRKARSRAQLERQKKERSRSPRYLIVCEGTKTEPHYFRELRDYLKIPPQSVRIMPSDSTSPGRIVAHALDVYDEDALCGDSFDKVFCVFDRDMHETFDAAVQRVSDLKSSSTSKPFEAITSTPCFEFWFLLHFGFTDQPFHASGKKSIGDKVIAALRKKPGFQTYGKGKQGIYAALEDKIHGAIESAEQLRKCSVGTGHRNPATDVDLLVLELMSLARA
jgi:hypothetical protein